MQIARLSPLLLLWALPALCQTTTGRISGTVTDQAGASVPGVAIVVRNEATQIAWKATTNESGYYVVPNLPPGPYTVAAELTGFKKATQSGFELNADGRLTADFHLEVGEVSSSVEVKAVGGEQVNVVSGEISRTIDQSQVQDLALNGRNYMQLVTLIPGAALLNDDQLALTTSLSTTGQAVNGNRPNTSNLTVDGAYNLDAGSNGSQINNVGIDFIREVQVQTSNFSAEYGRQSGAAINVVTRSGGNTYHGSAFEFLRNDKLDARNFFSPSKPSLRFNDFGWSLGGPIKKNKIYFFGGQEWKYIRRYTDPVLRTLPTRAERAGNFSGRTGTLNIPGTTTAVPNRDLTPYMTADGRAIAKVYDAMEKLAVSYVDTPTGNNAIYQMSNPFQVRQDMLRMDYRINDRHSLYGRYMHDNYNVIDPFGTFISSQLPTVPGNRQRPATSWQLGETWMVTPHIVNEIKANAGWHSQRVFLDGTNWQRDQYGFTYQDLFPGGGRYPTGIPSVSVTGFSSFTGPTFYVSTTTDISFSDVVTFVEGAHTIRAGALFTRNRKDANTRPVLPGVVAFNPSGNTKTTGNAFADALTGNFRTYSESQYDAFGFFRFSQYDAFVTDQWHVRRNLSIEAGLRFQAMLPVYTQANNVSNFVPSAYNPAQAVTVTPSGALVAGSGNYYNGMVRAGEGIPSSEVGRVPDANSAQITGVPAGAPRGLYEPAYPVAPRFSFAWSPLPANKMAVRGGFGVFYDRFDQVAIVQAASNPPFGSNVQLENGNLANPSSGNASARAVLGTVRAIDQNIKTPVTMNYSLGVQREMFAGIFLDVAYVGNQSRHLMRGPDINLPPFAVQVANQELPTAQRANTNALRPYKGYSTITMRMTDANGNYNGLQLYATKRKGWFTWTAAYTWSKALTEASSNTDTSDEPFNRHINYGPASFDRRHVFVSTFNAKLPFLSKGHGVARGAFGGWELSGVMRAQSGPYYDITSSTAIGTRKADYLGGPVEGPKTAAEWFNTAAFGTPPLDRFGTAGVGIVEGPGLVNWDFSLRKQFRISEAIRLRFQGDLFNAFNHTNLKGLNLVTTNRDFGSVTGASPARQVQLGMRLTF